MQITKYGHCCLLVETNGVRILTDPGNYNDTPHAQGLQVILLTHEHQDHIHISSLREILEQNPEAKIFTHPGVGEILAREKISHTSLSDNEEVIVHGVPISSHGTEHACIHHDLPLVRNTGFFIDKRLFYPGDSLYNPHLDIEILALPVSAPWLKLEEAIEYAKTIKPTTTFPVHDGMLRQDHRLLPTRRIPKAILEPLGITFIDMIEGSVVEF